MILSNVLVLKDPKSKIEVSHYHFQFTVFFNLILQFKWKIIIIIWIFLQGSFIAFQFMTRIQILITLIR